MMRSGEIVGRLMNALSVARGLLIKGEEKGKKDGKGDLSHAINKIR